MEEAEKAAAEDVVAQREAALAKQLAEMKRQQEGVLVDPLQFEMSIQAEDLAGYVPAFGWEMRTGVRQTDQVPGEAGNSAGRDRKCRESRETAGPSEKETGRKSGAAKADQTAGKQRFPACGNWTFEQANNMISRIAAQGWRGVPKGADPATYVPDEV